MQTFSFNNPIHFFVVLSLFFGILFTFIIPPFQSPDEYNHFYKSWHISDGHLLPQKIAQNRIGGILPSSLALLKDTFYFLKDDYNAKTSFNQLFHASKTPLALSNKKFIDFANTAVFAPTAYIPQAFGISIGKLLHASPLFSLYLARLINLFAWMYFIYLALQRITFHRWSFAYIACLPSVLFMSASANADNITNSLCVWLIAIFCTSEHFSYTKKTIILSIVSVNKLIFVPLVLLEWIYKKSIGMFILVGSVTLLSAFLWANYAKKNFITYDNYDITYRDSQTLNEGVNPTLQLEYIMHNPIIFAKTALLSFAKSIPATSVHLFGKFGWEKNYLPFWTVAVLIGGLFVMMFSQSNPLSLKARFLLVLSVVLGMILFSIIMYMIWSPVAFPSIDNFGGRYFFVFLFILPLIVGIDYFKKDVTKLHLLAKAVLITGNLIMVFCILGRYYI